jgi:hypothetical protein
VGDGPDWRQVDRARLLAVRLEERKKVQEEWASWCEGFSEFALEKLEYQSAARLEAKAKELRAPPSPPPLPEPKSTAVP